MGAECCRVKSNGKQNGDKHDDCKTTDKEPIKGLDVNSEPIFPPALMKYVPQPLRIVGDRVTWYRPLTLESLLRLKTEHPQARIVVGNTEVGIETKFKHAVYPVIITPTHVPELSKVEVREAGIDVGASVTINNLRSALENLVKERKEHETRGLRAILAQMRWFAGNQIRNAACLAGNIVTASPISDLNPVFVATVRRICTIYLLILFRVPS